jgi:CRP-like cAMP-binding protein
MTATEQGQELRIPKGTVIFRQGDPGNEMFVISKGKVRLSLSSEGHQKEVGSFGEGDFFGELSLLGGVARTATAEATEDSILLPISYDVFAMMVQDDLEIVFRMLNVQGQRLRRTNEPIQQLIQQRGRIRIVARCLKHAVGGGTGSLGCDEIVRDLGVPAAEVKATLTDLAARGAGRLDQGEWRAGPEHLAKLAEALCAYAAA